MALIVSKVLSGLTNKTLEVQSVKAGARQNPRAICNARQGKYYELCGRTCAHLFCSIDLHMSNLGVSRRTLAGQKYVQFHA